MTGPGPATATSDDGPGVSRRIVLGAATALLSSQAFPGPAATQPAPGDRFMALSKLLIAHRLDPVIGSRIAAGLDAGKPPFAGHIDVLLDLAHSRNATQLEDFLPFADPAAQAAALRIISAWYLGVCENVPGATVIAYELALMFQPTADVMTIPTYAISGPNGWGANAAPLAAMPIF